MREALSLAEEAFSAGEVPVGAVVVKDGKVIGRGRNRREEHQSVLGHAELEAMEQAAKVLGSWRLTGCTLYVTLEPCQMCAGAIIQSRMDRVVIASMNPKAGCAGSVINLLEMDGFNHKAQVTRGILEEECSQMLSGFFKELREEKARKKQAAKENEK